MTSEYVKFRPKNVTLEVKENKVMFVNRIG